MLKDYDIAFGWFRLAALQGHQKARKKLAYMYNYGLGVPQNIEKANYWYKLAGPTDPTDALASSTRSRGRIESATRHETPRIKLPAPRKKVPLPALQSKDKEYTRKNREFYIGSSFGYRYDQFNWNIAGASSGCCPNVLSELSWKDLHIGQFTLDATGRVSRFYYRARFGYGAIFEGNVLDTDFGSDNRGNIWSKLQADADRGHVLDAKIGLGFSLYHVGFQFLDQLEGFDIVPMLGWNFSKQKIMMREPASRHIGGGALQGLDSTYSARWMGPWVGLDFHMKKSNNWDMVLGFEYHLADYYAEANWNLNTTMAHPKSFEHFNNGMAGQGILGRLDLRYQFSRKWSGTFLTEFQTWNIEDGTDRTFQATGGTTDTALNEVNWQSFTTRLGVLYAF